MARPRFERDPDPHGALGFVIGLFAFGLSGAILLASAGLSGWVPGWLPAGPGAGIGLRIALGALGVALVAIGFGFLRHRAWAWWGGLAWAGWSAVEVLRALDPGAVSAIPLPQLLAVAAIPYLWSRRRDFGVVRERRGREPSIRSTTRASR